MRYNNIIMISDNREVADNTVSKIMLLRAVDSVGVMDYKTADNIIGVKSPDLLLIYVEKDEDIDFIQKIRNYDKYKNTFILMITNSLESDFLCRAFDAGIDDFVDVEADEMILNMRIMWGLKNKVVRDISQKKSEILAMTDIVDKTTGFYKKTHTQNVFDREYKRSLPKYNSTVFMVLASDIHCRQNLSVQKLSGVLKNIVRSVDMVGFAPDGKMYLLLFNTDENGAKNFFERVNNALDFDLSISAAAVQTSSADDFKDAETVLNKDLAKALEKSNTFIFETAKAEKSPSGFFDKTQLKDNNQQMLKRVFLKKIEKTVSPSFFKMQSIYEPKLFDTEIKQFSNEKESIFVIRNKEFASTVSVKYGDYSKIVIEINESFKSDNECDTIVFEPEELTCEKLENIIQSAAERFRDKIYKREK